MKRKGQHQLEIFGYNWRQIKGEFLNQNSLSFIMGLNKHFEFARYYESWYVHIDLDVSDGSIFAKLMYHPSDKFGIMLSYPAWVWLRRVRFTWKHQSPKAHEYAALHKLISTSEPDRIFLITGGSSRTIISGLPVYETEIFKVRARPTPK